MYYTNLYYLEKIVLCCASSGIAALLLPGGRTSHSRFKIPLQITESSTCAISHNSPLGELLRITDLIIWDEVPMQHKYCFEAVNRTLNDICGFTDSEYFGQIPILLGGDFAQILPVIPKGNRTQTVEACIQKSHIWRGIQVLNLNQNMRVQSGFNNSEFVSWLGNLSYNSNWYGQIPLPAFIHTVTNICAFCDFIYPPHLLQIAHHQYTIFSNRAILTPHNETVSELNSLLLAKLHGELHIFNSEDTADINDIEMGIDYVPVEYLQSLNPASLPPSQLHLRVGAPVILLRNLDPKRGLCNGTRMAVTKLGRRCIQVVILTGEFSGTTALLPRIPLSSTEGDLPFILSRKQFPIRLSFAITINKAQGQSLDMVGVDLRNPVFTHGQLYVALSRTTNVDNMMILLPEIPQGQALTVTNVVYPEVLLNQID